jgi:3-oxoacyl-[acyl-carrier protein] reductase
MVLLMKASLEKKVAVVTGGTRGIGAAIVRRLARDGAAVAFSYVASPERAAALVREIEEKGGQALALKADQADPAAARGFVQAVHERFSKIDIVVASAGLFVSAAVDDASADWKAIERMLAVNVGGVAALVRAAVARMNDGGRIVTIGTTGATHIAFPGLADYVASKAAVAAYSRGWARDLGPRGITVNVIQPGAIRTEMNTGEGAFAEVLTRMTALGRYGEVDEIAGAVAFLAGPDAKYITGATLNVDGGQIA